jgi:hypothetical protein
MQHSVRVTQTPDEYVKEWENDPWFPAIWEAHELLRFFIPGYTPVQIKDKFGGLRFYFTIDSEINGDDRKLYQRLGIAITNTAEAKCREIDRRLVYERGVENGKRMAAEEQRRAEEAAAATETGEEE